jgi:hypothetical protein
MKKIIALLALMLCATVSVTAQEKKDKSGTEATVEGADSFRNAALKDADALGQVITYKDAKTKQNFVGLFEIKHRELAQGLNTERKAQLAQTIEAKIKASLSPEDLQKLENKPALMKRLTQQ